MKKPIKAAAKAAAKGMSYGKGMPDAKMSKMGKKTDAKKPVAVKK